MVAADASSTAYAKQSNTSLIVGVVAAFHAVALVTSGLRMYTRGFLLKNVRREDYVVGVATVGLCSINLPALLLPHCSAA